MKYSEFKEKVEALSHHYEVIGEDTGYVDNYICVLYKGKSALLVDRSEGYNLIYGDLGDTFEKLPFCRKLYMFAAEIAVTPLADRVEQYAFQLDNGGFYNPYSYSENADYVSNSRGGHVDVTISYQAYAKPRFHSDKSKFEVVRKYLAGTLITKDEYLAQHPKEATK